MKTQRQAPPGEWMSLNPDFLENTFYLMGKVKSVISSTG